MEEHWPCTFGRDEQGELGHQLALPGEYSHLASGSQSNPLAFAYLRDVLGQIATPLTGARHSIPSSKSGTIPI